MTRTKAFFNFGILLAMVLSALFSGEMVTAAEPPTCPASSIRCWYLIFGKGERPTERLYFADVVNRPSNSEIKQVDVMDVPQKDGDGADYYVYTMDFNCQQKKMRQNKAYRAFADGKIETKPMSEWVPVTPGPFLRAYELACDPQVKKNLDRHAMAFVGTMFRPIDLADVTRQLFWTQKITP